MHHEEPSNASSPSYELHRDLHERTRTPLLISSLAVSSATYIFSELDDLPHSSIGIFDLPEHAAHLAPGIALGYAFKVTSERLSANTKKCATTLSVAGVAAVAAIFETHISDVLWYRNTTKDINDVFYTVVAGVVGALCLRNKKTTT